MVSGAFAVGFLPALFVVPVSRRYLAICAFVMLARATAGGAWCWFPVASDLRGPSASLLQNLIDGAAAVRSVVLFEPPSACVDCALGT